MTTKKDQPMEVGETTTDVVEQESSQHAEMQAQTGIPPNTETEEIVEKTTQEQLRSTEDEIPESVMVEEENLADGASSEESVPIPILNGETETDRKNEGGENPITDSNLDAHSTGAEEGIPKQDGETNDGKEKPKKKRSASRKEKKEVEVSEVAKPSKKKKSAPTIEEEIKASSTVQESNKSLKTAQSEQNIVAIDSKRTVQTEEEMEKDDLVDLVESLQAKKIISGVIQGIELMVNEPVAVLYHGAIKVIIPALEVINPPSDYRGVDEKVVHLIFLKKRLGTEIDFIVKGIDKSKKFVVASRREAMAQKCKSFYFGTDRTGINILYPGICAEARVVNVLPAGIFVELFGIEIFVPLRELSYQRVSNAGKLFQPGQRVIVKILSIDRTDKNNVKASVSVKQASENPYEKALKKYIIDNTYVGTVSLVDTAGIFVALDGGIDCLCPHTKRVRPAVGAHVAVKILGKRESDNRIWGVITYVSNSI